MYLISDNIDTLTGMRLAGVDGIVVHEREELRCAIENAMEDKDVGVILLTEKFGREFPDLIDEIKLERTMPLLIEIPDRHGTGRKKDFITSYVNEAIGRAESVTAKQQLNMAMSKAQLELKREMGKTQTELKTELFEEVQLKLLAFMRTEEYKEVLIRYIEKAAQFASGMAMTIYINPSDADKKTYLEERTGMTLTISKVDFIGGVRAVVPEKNVLVDYAFKGALENEYQKFQFRGGVKGE